MADALDHARTVLSAIIPNRLDLLEVAGTRLAPEHFQDATMRNLFQLLLRYEQATGGIITRAALGDVLRNQADAGRVMLYEETYDALRDRQVDDSDFRHSLGQLIDLETERATTEALTQGMQILRTGATDDKGTSVKGDEAARHFVMEKFAEIDKNRALQHSPEGDMRREYTELIQDYADRAKLRSEGGSRGVLFGVSDLDYKINGLQRGELALIVGYSSDGKTSLCVQLAWDAAVMQGLNVVFLTTETLRDQVRRKILARHSMLPNFGLAPNGLNTRDLRNGSLSPEEVVKLQEVAKDFTTNPGYGRLYVAQVQRNATISTCEARLFRLQQKFLTEGGKGIDLVVIDYLRLLRSDRRRQSDREELGAILVETKQLATTFADGSGVPVVSPWQVNRSAKVEAERVGYYTSAATAETAETTNSADVMVSVLAPSDNEDRRCEIKGQILKNRDGEKSHSIIMQVDYATSMFTAASRDEGMAALIGEEPAQSDDFSSLLG